ncbi:MAG: hypothetical protein IJK51_07745 [Bacteroidaceae bacterium]|nr:hypothetical protein [Bacteroidaceae bacterium]
MSKKSFKQPQKPAQQKVAAAPQKRGKRLLPVLPIFFLLTWLWAAWYYGSVFYISREYSLWSADTRIMGFILCQPYGILRYIGRAMLLLYKYPWLGGLLMAAMLTAGSWLVGYCMRLKATWRPVQYLPALLYMAIVTWYGLDIFFEARTGFIFGIPFVALVVLCIWSIMIRSFSRKPAPAFIGIPKDETPRQNGLQLLVIVVAMAAIIGFDLWQRPYVRVICKLLDMEYRQDWAGIQKLARAHATMSNRPMACSYAISLVQTGQVSERLFEIRMDYDSLYIHGMDGHHNNASSLYVPEGNYFGGFIQSSQHACMEQMVMTGPTIRLLKLSTKCALMNQEWELAEKYLTILRKVPFEGAFCEKYGKMVRRLDLVNADKEMAMIRLTEPLHDSFENQYQQPLFMGYNLMLVEGRSQNALLNSLVVCLYTKLMPQFIERLEPLAGSTPPSIIMDGILLAENKHPGIAQNFNGLNFRQPQLQAFIQNTQPYMSDRPAHAYELFPKYKGYYPYYYFFGNLKATRKGYTSLSSSSSGVN